MGSRAIVGLLRRGVPEANLTVFDVSRGALNAVRDDLHRRGLALAVPFVCLAPDATVAQTAEALQASGANLVVSMVPPPFAPALAEAAVTAHCHYVSSNFPSPAVAALGARASSAGVSLLEGHGFDPGTDERMAEQMATQFSRIHEVTSLGFGGPADPSFNAVCHAGAWTPRGILAALIREAYVVADGEVRCIPGLDILSGEHCGTIQVAGHSLDTYPNGDVRPLVRDLQEAGVDLSELRRAARLTGRWPGWLPFARWLVGSGLVTQEELPRGTPFEPGVVTHFQLLQLLVRSALALPHSILKDDPVAHAVATENCQAVRACIAGLPGSVSQSPWKALAALGVLDDAKQVQLRSKDNTPLEMTAHLLDSSLSLGSSQDIAVLALEMKGLDHAGRPLHLAGEFVDFGDAHASAMARGVAGPAACAAIETVLTPPDAGYVGTGSRTRRDKLFDRYRAGGAPIHITERGAPGQDTPRG
jgi:alpha-aminoadipic semialdehyde synthase